ncbi:transglutaminase-like domain-containing protein [Candidatus Uabimicrobium amorphum]|uniref:Transglutaminase n=1 Tax=Uabimicrobium amorphum TaxID=2596890 RepID=A0A5S9II85_UABAM|nr:transglutaminase-like domain-containing protein [Candidatus Uabimicrobium amorphum]BBM82309.1 transglutaminase [Candidatus Uabimicrobium amorphum]
MRYIFIVLLLAANVCGQVAANNTVFDSWYSGELFGAKAIAMHNVVRKTTYEGKEAYEVNVYYKMKIARGDDKFEMTTTENTLVYADLTPISTVSKSIEGAQKKIVTTTFSQGEVLRQTQIDDTVHKETLKTDKKIILDEAVYLYSLVKDKDLQKGATYEYFSLNDETIKIETNTLKILGKTAEGNWEVEITSTENSFAYTMFIDSKGEIAAITIPGMNVNAVRTTREQAEIFSEQLILDIMFPCNVILPEEEHVTQTELSINTHKLSLQNSEYQTVSKTEEGIRIVLHEHRPQVEENYTCSPQDSEKFSKYLKAQPLIQSNSPLIVNKATEIVSAKASTYTQVQELQKWVFEKIKKASTSTANASSIATLNAMAGDCTEHANLFCALARSLKIPTRVCGGLVYLDGEFGLHAWNEVYLGKWLVVDCALNRLGSNGKYIFFSYDYEKDDSDLIMNMMGSRPQIEIENVWHGDKKVNMRQFVKDNDKWQVVEDQKYQLRYEVNNLWSKNDYSSDEERIVQYTMNVNSAIIYSFFGCGDNELDILQPLIANHLGKNFSSWKEREVQDHTVGSLAGKLGVYDATLDGKKLTLEIFFAVHNKIMFNIRVIYLTAEKEKYREQLIKSMNSMKLNSDDNKTESPQDK